MPDEVIATLIDPCDCGNPITITIRNFPEREIESEPFVLLPDVGEWRIIEAED